MTHPTLPITVCEWWRNRRGEAVRARLSIIDTRTWHSTEGKLVPGKGFAADIKHLPRLTAALAKAEAKARELGLIKGDQ